MSRVDGGSSDLLKFGPLHFTLDRREILRLLGYGARRRQPHSRIEERIDEMLREARELVDPRGYSVIRALAVVPKSGPFRGAERMAYGVCTIGASLERRVTELSKQEEPLRALVLDAVGSACVEAAADIVNASICERIEQKDLFSSRRISPGFSSWPIEGQKTIFELLPSHVTGVKLHRTMFMEPRKSVSFGIGIGCNVRHSKYVSICAYCNLTSCPYRRNPEVHPTCSEEF